MIISMFCRNTKNLGAIASKGHISKAFLILLPFAIFAIFPFAAFAAHPGDCFNCHIMHNPGSSAAIVTYNITFPRVARICNLPGSGGSRSEVVTFAEKRNIKKPSKPKATLIKGSCVKCHGTVTDVKLLSAGGKIIPPFTRHPIDVIMPGSADPSSYATPYSDSRSPDVVMCLSCHIVHARGDAHIPKWDYVAIIVSEGSCSICHPENAEQ